MIRKLDGSKVIPSGSLRQYKPDSNEHSLFDIYDQETIAISGSPILYYKIRIDQTKVDGLYHEIRDKSWDLTPIRMCALYEPIQPMHNVEQFGLDNPADMSFVFNRAQFISEVGESPRSGSLIKAIADGTFWEIMQVNINISADNDRMLWGRHRLQVIARNYQASASENDPFGFGKATNEARDKPSADFDFIR